jgi:ribulose-5-phosphate 4-epimerase/fuculose-1-phosphate aldolase
MTDVVRDLLAGCAVVDGERLTSAFGHLSARDVSGDVLVSGNQGPGLVRTPDDLVRVDLSGAALAGDAGLRPGELPIHLAILARRHDLASVCRFHGPAGLAWSTLGRDLPAAIGMGLFLGAVVPLYETTTTITTAGQAEALAELLGDGNAVLLRGFGAVTVGRSVKEAVVRAWFLEQSASAALTASAAGAVQPFPLEAAEPFAAAEGAAAAQIDRLWNYLSRRWADGIREDD